MPLDDSLDKTAVLNARQPALAISNRTVANAVTLGFLAANLLFALRLSAVAALVVIAGCVGVWRLVASRPKPSAVLDAPLRPRRLALCLLIALVVFILGGETHLFYANVDWLTRDAVLADLSRTWSLPAYVEGGARYLLRAPLGLYMLPAAVGEIFGLTFAHVALLAQDTFLLGGILYLMWTASSGWRTIAVMLLWGGLSGLQRLPLLLQGKPLADVLATPIVPFDQWHPLFQYSSTVTQMFWVPNHALPGWWITLLLLLYAQAEIDLAVVAASVGALTLWSPLAILPAIPSAAALAARRLPALVGQPRFWQGIATALAFIPVAIYLVASAGSIAHEVTLSRSNFILLYSVFELIELPAALFVACNIRRLRAPLRGLFWINFAILLALPCFSFGPGNDLVMRGSIASLTIVAFCFGEVLFGPDRPALVGKAVGLAIVAVGALCAAGEIGRAVTMPPYAISDCTLMQAARNLGGAAPTNYVTKAEAMPRWLAPAPRSWPAEAPRRSCWAMTPLPG
jgi:hypothetical protein